MSTAIQVFAQTGQRAINTRALTMFDFGVNGNQQHYGQSSPPVYNLSRVDNRFMVFFSGTKDILADRIDLDRARRELGAPLWRDISVPDFGHLDLTFGIRSDQFVVAPIMQILQQSNVL